MNNELVQDLHLTALSAIAKACISLPVDAPQEERSTAVVLALCEQLAAEYLTQRGIQFTDDGQAEDAATAAYRALQIWCDRELEKKRIGQAVTSMLTPPAEAHRRGHNVTRVARVVLTWDQTRQDWDATEPQGIANYVESPLRIADVARS